MKWYYYLHSNVDLIGKNPAVVDPDPAGYFEGPFVMRYWLIDTEDRRTCWVMILEALAKGARLDRIRELCEKWHMDHDDSIEMITRLKPTEIQKGGMEIFIKEILKMDPNEYWEEISLRSSEQWL